MKQQVGPVAIATVVVVTVVLLGFFFYRSMKPAYYIPSPGAGGRPQRSAPDYGPPPADRAVPGQRQYVVPPPGSRAGDPNSLKKPVSP